MLWGNPSTLKPGLVTVTSLGVYMVPHGHTTVRKWDSFSLPLKLLSVVARLCVSGFKMADLILFINAAEYLRPSPGRVSGAIAALNFTGQKQTITVRERSDGNACCCDLHVIAVAKVALYEEETKDVYVLPYVRLCVLTAYDVG
jgi:hypothetical protein